MRPYRYLYLIMITILLLPAELFAVPNTNADAFQLIHSTPAEIDISFTLPEWNIQESANNRQQVKVKDSPYLFIGEEETMPVFSTMVAIPNQGGVNLQVISSLQSTVNGFTAAFETQLIREQQQGRFLEDLYPANNIVTSEPKILRDFRVVTLNVYPFQYNRKNKQLQISETLNIKLTFTDTGSINELKPNPFISRSFDSIYRGLILNYDSLLQTRESNYRNPVMLVIYGDYSDAIYTAKINEYISWKKQRGFIVNAVSTGVTGSSNTNIKNYIQTAYDNPATRPDYIVLIGDTNGAIAIPSINNYIDYQYTWLAGNDDLGDAMIGRISVSSTADLDVILAKIISLEKNIEQHSMDWLNRMLLVGDSADSGISTIYTNRYVQNISAVVNPEYSYTELYGFNPSNADINSAINQGVTFYNYRGIAGMSGWPNTISSMYNSHKLFHSIFITCNTGNFNNSTSITEQVIRYGTAASLGGAVTSIGMADQYTHTPMNNCLDLGIFYGIYCLGMRDMASALLYAKLYLNLIYGISHPVQAQNFAAYCNLMGDPTAIVYVGIPDSFVVNTQSSIPAGSANIRIGVNQNAGFAVEGAYVTLTAASGLQFTDITDSTGFVTIALPAELSEDLVLTVCKDDFITYTCPITVNTNGGIVLESIQIDDALSGNGDETVNPGEEINLFISLRNTGSSTLFVTGRVSADDSYVTLLEYDRLEFGDISSNGCSENLNPIVFSVSPACPDGHIITLVLTAESSGFTWIVNVPVTVRGGNLKIVAYTFIGLSERVIRPGVSCPLQFSLKNTGLTLLNDVSGKLSSLSGYFVIQDSTGYFGTINPDATSSCNDNSFYVFARNSSVVGMVIPLILTLSNSDGFMQTIHLSITIGTNAVNDPLGQDVYGYFIYDESDLAYNLCPDYQWIPIALEEGGYGTKLSLYDPGYLSDEGDVANAVAIQTVDLPFSFTFYGKQYTQVSICSNGFLAFGQTLNADWRNWRLPGAGGPNAMIAVFWDDLQIGLNSGVYTYYNALENYFVVEWYNLISGYDISTPETFQAILYDPVYYHTLTNDGQIKLQYNIFNNIDEGSGDVFPHGNYCTIGIKDHFGTDGLEYTFNNSYPPAASPLSDGKALFITTSGIISELPHLNIAQTLVLDNNFNSHLEPGETADLLISLSNDGLSPAEDVIGVLSCSDPYVTINAATSNYGDIAGVSEGLPQNYFNISISPSCPGAHLIDFTLSLSSSEQNWNYSFNLSVYTPVFAIGTYVIEDVSGNNDSILDPGETVNLSVQFLNRGEIACDAGSANINTTNPGVTFITGMTSFASIPANGSSELIFTFNVDASTPIGTRLSLPFTATAGNYNFSGIITLDVGAAISVNIGTETGINPFPFYMNYYYSASEAIYLASEIGMFGLIKSIAYYKAQGDNVSPIENVRIFMKHTSSSSLSTGSYDLNEYTLVYSGSFTNDAISGWMGVNLSPGFVYNGTDNLSILCLKGYQPAIDEALYWTYTTTTITRTRQKSSVLGIPLSLTQTNKLPNLKLEIFGADNHIFPPLTLRATPANRLVTITWQAPPIGNFSSFNLYKNNVFLANVANPLMYYDVDVNNGETFSYYLTSVYGGNESIPSITVQATPDGAFPRQAILGCGMGVTENTTASPINNYANSIHGQSIYTAAELNAAGIYGPIEISQLGFDIDELPIYTLPNYLIRMKHTTAPDVSSWQSPDGMVVVYTNPAYLPEVSGWNMFPLSSPFLWNGIDNIVVDTAYGIASDYYASGTVMFTLSDNNYRYVKNYNYDETNVFTGGTTSNCRPDLKLVFATQIQNPLLTVIPAQLDFGNNLIGSSTTQQFTIHNTGNYLLTGYFSVPEGYSLTSSEPAKIYSDKENTDRDSANLHFTIEAGDSVIYNLTFIPASETSYNGNLNIISNAVNCHNLYLPLTGSGCYPSLPTPVVIIFRENNNIILQWEAVPNAVSYQIYHSDRPDCNFTLLGTTSQLQFTDPVGSRSFYFVKASSR